MVGVVDVDVVDVDVEAVVELVADVDEVVAVEDVEVVEVVVLPYCNAAVFAYKLNVLYSQPSLI